MKRILIIALIASFGMMVTNSCKKDEDNCTPPPVEENIIGKWTAVEQGGDLEFKADGTYIDDDDVILGTEVNGVKYDQRSYTILNGNVLRVKISPANSNDSAVAELDITENNCNQIKLGFDIFGETYIETLNRK